MFDYEWDPEKARFNLRKHGVSFADATAALEDERALTLEDDHLDEQRFITIGADALGRILVVIYTYRSEAIRIISARNATPSERRYYQEEKP
ncbi:MAG TPA: BrnT family toxin [Anaerolineales bacterium]|nr:BrnT family toxin [Anaerolineales bacterium]